jgi:glucose/arabinose dehydrogenase
VKRTTIQMIWSILTIILVLTTSLYAVYAFDTTATTTGSTADKGGYNETRTNDNTTLLALQEDDSDIKRKTVNLEVINPTEIPNGKLEPQFIASLINGNLTVGGRNLLGSNPDFILIDNQSGIIGYASPSYWEDSLKSCDTNFTCKTNLTTGWRDNKSLQISTKSPHNTNGPWSWIYGKELGVSPNERYELVTHMKLNNLARESHIVFEGFNETLKNWIGIKQCPPGVDRSLEWHEFSCEVTIPNNITEIRPVLNAGWSSQRNKEATTWFDDVYMIRLAAENFPLDVPTIVNDPKLKIEVVTSGLERPTSMAFLGPNDILVLEKNKGTVQRIINGTELPEPLLDFNVGNLRERGLVGIAVAAKNENGFTNGTTNAGDGTHVFLYLTESKNGDTYKAEPLSNHLYRYDLENNKLVNPKLLLELPLTSRSIHNGGIVLIGPDNNVYTVVGDLEGQTKKTSTKAQNYIDGPDPDGRAGILRMTQKGEPVNDTGILGDKHPLDLYYAYGIRNSFGMDFDPITGRLWDTENGPSYGDEINLVEPGFNSGWKAIAGNLNSSNVVGTGVARTLEDFNGKGKYSDPEYEWSETVGPTALKFLNSDKLGTKYENDMFVGDFDNGNIYHFKLNKVRTKLNLDSPLEGTLNEKVIFARGFSQYTAPPYGGITDIEVGPDGYLYIVSYGQGKIFRIVPRSLQ